MKKITIYWTAIFHEEVEAPDDWEYDGELDSLLQFTEMPFSHPSGELNDFGVT